MTQQLERPSGVSVRPPLPHVERSGFEVLSEEERAVQDAMHRFARDVMRPAGVALDRLTAEAAVAPDSPYWEFLATCGIVGIGFDSAPEGLPPQVAARLQALVIEEFGWGDAGLAVSLAAAAFPNLMARRAGNQELIELTEGKLGAWVATQPDRGSDATMLYPASGTPRRRVATEATSPPGSPAATSSSTVRALRGSRTVRWRRSRSSRSPPTTARASSTTTATRTASR
jgi:hypothetical protein